MGRVAFIFRAHFSGKINLRACNMTMHINAPRHDDPAGRINNFFWEDISFYRWGNNFAIFDPDIPDFAIDAIGWVVDFPAFDYSNRHPDTPAR